MKNIFLVVCVFSFLFSCESPVLQSQNRNSQNTENNLPQAQTFDTDVDENASEVQPTCTHFFKAFDGCIEFQMKENPKVNQFSSASLEIKSRDLKDHLDISPSQLSVYPFMPSMGHGSSTKVDLYEDAKGVFSIEGIVLNMPGQWEIRLQYTDSNNKTHEFVLHKITV